MGQTEITSDLFRLYESFLNSYRKSTKKIKKSKNANHERIETAIILELLKMSGNNRSKVFSSSAIWLNPDNSEALSAKGLIQTIPCEHGLKHALSLAGIAECIRLKSKISLEQQYHDFLELADKKFNKTEDVQLDRREKLAAISLILLSSTSEQSAIKLVNDQNKTVLLEVFQEVLSCMKKYHFAEEKDVLKSSGRGEDIAAGHFARLDTLPRRTNHYYYGKDYVYYLDIETNRTIDAGKLVFILRKFFSDYDETSDFGEMYTELSHISQKYSPRFLCRTLDPLSILTILNQLKEFLEADIYHLRPKMKQ
jgi:hypothetical protein